jgi:hypothetical protein
MAGNCNAVIFNGSTYSLAKLDFANGVAGDIGPGNVTISDVSSTTWIKVGPDVVKIDAQFTREENTAILIPAINEIMTSTAELYNIRLNSMLARKRLLAESGGGPDKIKEIDSEIEKFKLIFTKDPKYSTKSFYSIIQDSTNKKDAIAGCITDAIKFGDLATSDFASVEFDNLEDALHASKAISHSTGVSYGPHSATGIPSHGKFSASTMTWTVCMGEKVSSEGSIAWILKTEVDQDPHAVSGYTLTGTELFPNTKFKSLTTSSDACNALGMCNGINIITSSTGEMRYVPVSATNITASKFSKYVTKTPKIISLIDKPIALAIKPTPSVGPSEFKMMQATLPVTRTVIIPTGDWSQTKNSRPTKPIKMNGLPGTETIIFNPINFESLKTKALSVPGCMGIYTTVSSSGEIRAGLSGNKTLVAMPDKPPGNDFYIL